MKLFVTGFFVLFYSSAMLASDCSIKITRTACPGKNDEAVEPYKTHPKLVKISDSVYSTTDIETKATTESACKEAGENAAILVRSGIVAQKDVIATFDTKEIGKFTKTKKCK